MTTINPMRALLASSIGVACAAALALPLAMTSGATATPAAFSASAGSSGAPAPLTGEVRRMESRPGLPGSTQSLPLQPLAGAHRALTALPGTGGAQGLPEQDVRPFSLVGVVWDDFATDLVGQVQVRTRAGGTKLWSAWQDIETHNDDAPGVDSSELGAEPARGSTAPLWVGNSDGVQARVLPDQPSDRSGRPSTGLPSGMRLELVAPGDEPGPGDESGRVAPQSPEAAESSAANAPLASLGATEIPALDEGAEAGLQADADIADADIDSDSDTDADADGDRGAEARKHIGPRPRIVTRAGWGADEKLRERKFRYTGRLKAAFIHHSASGNNYKCSQTPAILRSIYRYHVKSSGWRDFGYNFAIDKCGTIYEGRAGGVARAVMGAHTLGFNSNTMGIAVLGTYTNHKPPKAATRAIAKLTAWKLGLYNANAKGRTTLVSDGGSKYRKGSRVKMNVISGHRDGFATECPGERLYAKLGSVRKTAANLQHR